MLQRGVSIDQLLEVLSDRLRDIMVLCACGDDTLLVELADQTRDEEITRAKRFDAAGVVHMIAICESVQRNVKMSASPRALLEAALVRLAMTEKLADVTAVLAGGGPIGAISGASGSTRGSAGGAGSGVRPKKP
ncbi:hypothetical protein JYU07_00170 [Roseiflexus sp. AH-315-K22]|nr:hypothetical protein [Roseiflexus sp. AH-315-K22]